MKTKKCPHCHAEISEEAILCKYCHSLLIDDDTENSGAGVADADQESTIVFNKQQLQQDDDRTRIFSAAQVNDQLGGGTSAAGGQNVIYDGYDQDEPEDYYDEEYEEEYEDEDEYSDYDGEIDPRKKTLMIAAVIAVGILIIVIVAVIVGYKIFGFSGKDDSSTDLDDIVVNANSSQSQNDVQDDNPSIQQSESQSAVEPSSEAQPADPSGDASNTGDDSDNAVSSDEDSSVSDSSVADFSSASDDTSSVSDTSSAGDSSADDSSYDISSGASSQADTSSAAVPTDDGSIIAAITPQISGTIASYEFRQADANYRYYYVYTEDNHGYSIAFNIHTGDAVIDMNY
ncbi:zinc ribbon domain-containing protein [Ruminococcus sp. Marseille-P6503]|uniref:zinc ribbon domain-containing protein n=1 Tax=Ruminococcus sp. Marseille-P6503 TaxID=2364796 RepID=UPI000F537F99|nr:zinc ribbon domain-containing protein [Ruminococcus sp. Marseille-P6503]